MKNSTCPELELAIFNILPIEGGSTPETETTTDLTTARNDQNFNQDPTPTTDIRNFH